MAVTIAAALVSSTEPQPVQIVLNGITAGLAYTVLGTAGGSSWPVPGGEGVSAGLQIVLVDNRAALNTPITYSVVVSNVTYTATPVTVTYGQRYLLQSLDGLSVVAFWWSDNDLPREVETRSAAFDVPGRDRPPVRYATGGDGGGTLVIRTNRTNTDALYQLIKSGRPVVLRTDGSVRDLAPVDLMLLVSASNVARRALIAPGTISTDRVWSLSYILVGDPQPTQALSAFTWDDFDAAMVARIWSNPVANPTFDANTTSWAAAGAGAVLTWQSTGGAVSPGYARLTSGGAVAMSVNQAGTFPVVAGDLFAAQAQVRGTVGRQVHLRMTWTGAASTQATAVAVASTTAWQTVTFTGTVPVGATAVRVDVLADVTGMVAGNVLDVDAVEYVERTNTVTAFPQDFDTIFASSDWDDFDTYDWSQLQ